MRLTDLPEEQRAEARRLLEHLTAACAADLEGLACVLAGKADRDLLGATEFEVRDRVHAIGARAIEAALAGRKGYDGCSRACPGCRESAKFQRWQARRVVTLLGELSVERAYYHCRRCHAGHCPRDLTLGLSCGDLSRGAEQAVTLAGTLGVSFAEAAAKVLPRLSGLRLAESTVERTTERAGAELGRRLAAGETFGPARDWDWQPDAGGKTCAYVSADLTGVGMQGPGGAAADGRLAAVAMVYNPGRPGQARYVAGLSGGLAALGGPLRGQAAQVGMDRAERWIAISDGGAGIEDWLSENFPRVEAVILDFYHAAGHLGEWAKALHPDDAAAAAALAGRWCHRLKHEGGRAALAGLRELDVGRRPAAREAHRQLLGYFANQAHRMDYPRYRRLGWQIGSGPVEAACKQVVNRRLKGSGMRWGEEGADAVCHLRALFRSEASQWDAFWAALAA